MSELSAALRTMGQHLLAFDKNPQAQILGETFLIGASAIERGAAPVQGSIPRAVSRGKRAEAYIRGMQAGFENPELCGDGDAMYQSFREWTEDDIPHCDEGAAPAEPCGVKTHVGGSKAFCVLPKDHLGWHSDVELEPPNEQGYYPERDGMGPRRTEWK